jgi:hypothetical protein
MPAAAAAALAAVPAPMLAGHAVLLGLWAWSALAAWRDARRGAADDRRPDPAAPV